jgi:hypothetical protein
VLAMAPMPFVERLAGNPDMPARARHVPGMVAAWSTFRRQLSTAVALNSSWVSALRFLGLEGELGVTSVG